MRCEVCGQEIRGQPFYRIIEGGRMTVCGRCSKFGSGDWDPRQVNRISIQSRPVQPRRARSDLEAAEELELIENYGELIRKSRQKMKLSVEDFANKINEKESVVKKLEQEDINPDSKLIKKVENTLNIRILEVVDATPEVKFSKQASSSRTLADIMKLTQKDEEKE